LTVVGVNDPERPKDLEVHAVPFLHSQRTSGDLSLPGRFTGLQPSGYCATTAVSESARSQSDRRQAPREEKVMSTLQHIAQPALRTRVVLAVVLAGAIAAVMVVLIASSGGTSDSLT